MYLEEHRGKLSEITAAILSGGTELAESCLVFFLIV
jgi:hypothetical protein